MKQTILLVLSIFIINVTLSGQDQHFTQFYASPLTLNPALTGAFNGKYRVALIYRDQWRNVLEFPFVTFSAAADFRFNMNFLNSRSKDAGSAGLLFYNDKVPGFDISNNQIYISTAYHKSLSPKNNQYLSLGVQAGIIQRNIGFSKLTFADQFNGTDGYTDPTGENLPSNNYSYSDLNVGLNYSYSPSRSTAVFAGVAYHHVTEPQVSFYFDEDNEDNSIDNTLYSKLTAYLNLRIPLSERVHIQPRALLHVQGPHFQINTGTNFRFLLNDVSGIALHIGGWVRPVQYEDENLQLDAVIMMAGIELNNFLLGFSYDATLNDLNTTRRGQGAFEISFGYLGEYEDETVICPKF